MAQIKTRILNKYDLLTNYNNATNFYPLKGEICIAEIPNATNDFKNPPAIGIKVGTWNGVDGDASKKAFKDLPWIQAIAGDIPAELKTAAGIDAEIAKLTTNRKLATVAELTTFESSVNSQITDINEKIGTEITFTKNNSIAKNVKALQDAVGTGATGLATKVAALENALPVADFKSTTVKQAIADAKNGAVSEAATAAAGIYQTKAQATEDHNGLSASISGLSDKIGTETLSVSGATTVIGAINKINSNLGTANQGLSTAQTDIENLKKVTKGYTAEGSIKTAIETADGKGQSALNKIGTATLANGKTTLSEEINAVNERVNTTESNITKVDNRIDAILGTDKVASGTQKTIRQIANEELAAQLIPGDAAEAYDTLQEIADWIQSHPGEASEMNTNIGNNAKAIEALKGLHVSDSEGFMTVADEVAAGIDNYNTNTVEKTYATQSTVTQVSRVANEAKAKADTAVQDVTTGSANGTISVDGTNVAVKGLGSAAYTEANAYATAAQGSAANSAVQSASFAGTAMTKTGTALSISQEDARSALGLGTAAYKADTYFGTAQDVSANATAISNMNGSLEDGNGIVETISQTSGKISATRRFIKPTDMSTNSDDVFIFYCGTASELIN